MNKTKWQKSNSLEVFFGHQPFCKMLRHFLHNHLCGHTSAMVMKKKTPSADAHDLGVLSSLLRGVSSQTSIHAHFRLWMLAVKAMIVLSSACIQWCPLGCEPSDGPGRESPAALHPPHSFDSENPMLL